MKNFGLSVKELKAINTVNRKLQSIIDTFEYYSNYRDSWYNILCSVDYFDMFGNCGYNVSNELDPNGLTNNILFYVKLIGKDNGNIEIEYNYNDLKYYLHFHILEGELMEYDCYKYDYKKDKKTVIKTTTFNANLNKHLKDYEKNVAIPFIYDRNAKIIDY